MVRYFGRTYNLRDISRTSPPPPQFDTAGGGASTSSTTQAITPEECWIGRDFLSGVVVQVFRKTSRAVRPKSIPVMYRQSFQAGIPGQVHEVVPNKGNMRKGDPLPADDLVVQHPGQRPSSGKCWIVLEGPWQGTYVRAVRYRAWNEEFEGQSNEKVPHWEVLEVTRQGGKTDTATGRRLLICNDHLAIIGDSQHILNINKPFISYQLGSRDDDDHQNPWVVHPEDSL